MRSTATLTNTTPASRIPLSAIQTMPPRARAWARRPRAPLFRRGWTTGSATFECACERLAIAHLRADPQTGRLRARIARDLGSGRTDGTARCRTHHGLGAADADREVGRARAALLLPAEELLDDPVLERVEGDDGEAPARPQHLERGRQRALDRAELVVHLDAERLEHPLRRVPLAEAGGRRHRVLDDFDEIAGALERLLLPAPHDRTRDLPRVALFPVALEDVREVALVGLVHELPRRVLGARIHAHVERRVDGVRETALGTVELHRRDTEVEEHHVSAHAVRRELLERRRELAVQEPRLHAGAAPEALEERRDRRVAVDRDQLS